MNAPLELAQQIADRLAVIDGVVAVVLGGSRARNAATANSDTDIGIYYHADFAPSIATLRDAARELEGPNGSGMITDYGEWGPWINGGGWLNIAGQPVDWLYRDLGVVSRHIAECTAGRTSVHYQPGHPHGFHNHIYMAEIHYCRPLYDPAGVVPELKARTIPYPPLMKAALLHSSWEAGFALETAKKSAARGESFYVAGCLFRCAACLVQVLFAMNEQYFMNEKGAVKVIDSFAIKPAGFAEIVTVVLGHPGDNPAELQASIERFAALVAECEGLMEERS